MDIRIRASYDQFVILLEFMERNGDTSKTLEDLKHEPGHSKRLRADKLWIEVTELLNSCYRGVKKPLDKWKRVWADWKTKTKKKALLIQHGGFTLEGSTSTPSLTVLEERLLGVMGLSKLIGEPIEENSVERGVNEHTGHSVNNLHYPWISEKLEETEESSSSQEYVIQEPVYMPLEIEGPPEHKVPVSIVEAHLPSPIDEREVKPKLSYLEEKPKRRRLISRRTWAPYRSLFRNFVMLEMRRLKLEKNRERRLYEKEMAQLKIESQRIELDRILYEQHHRLIDTLINLLPKHKH